MNNTTKKAAPFSTERQALEYYKMCVIAMRPRAMRPYTEALTATEHLFGADNCELAAEQYKQDVLSSRDMVAVQGRIERGEEQPPF